MNDQLFQGIQLGVSGLVGAGMLWLNAKFDTFSEKIERVREVSDLKNAALNTRIENIEKSRDTCQTAGNSQH